MFFGLTIVQIKECKNFFIRCVHVENTVVLVISRFNARQKTKFYFQILKREKLCSFDQQVFSYLNTFQVIP